MKKLVAKLIVLLPFFVSVAFALLVIFGLVGSVFRPESMLPVAILVLTVLGWAGGRIIREGLESARFIRAVLASDDEEPSNDE